MIPPECTIKEIEDALRWARKGGTFDHLREDVPKAAQPWVKARLMLVKKRFDDWAFAVGIWGRMQESLPLGVLDPALQDWLREHVMPVLARLESVYEYKIETGVGEDHRSERYKEECQATYDFIVSRQMPDYMSALPYPLQRNINDALEVPGRHLEKEAFSVEMIADGFLPMSRTAKDVDAPCKEAVESGVPELISALKTKLRELRQGATV